MECLGDSFSYCANPTGAKTDWCPTQLNADGSYTSDLPFSWCEAEVGTLELGISQLPVFLRKQPKQSVDSIVGHPVIQIHILYHSAGVHGVRGGQGEQQGGLPLRC